MAEETSLTDAIEGIETEIVTCDPRSLLLLEKNARYMKAQTLQRLVENIKRDGTLTSLPFAVREGEGLRVLSGNHRVLAAIEAGLERINVLVSLTELSPARQKAIQLSHNSLVGEDDPLTLRALFEELGDVTWKAYSGLDDASLELMAKAATPGLGTEGLDLATLTLTFLPGDLERMRETFARIAPGLKGEAWTCPSRSTTRPPTCSIRSRWPARCARWRSPSRTWWRSSSGTWASYGQSWSGTGATSRWPCSSGGARRRGTGHGPLPKPLPGSATTPGRP